MLHNLQHVDAVVQNMLPPLSKYNRAKLVRDPQRGFPPAALSLSGGLPK